MVFRKIFKIEEFERRLRNLSEASKRQSDRSRPHAVFNTKVTTLSGIQGQEYIGLSILSICAIPGILNDSRVAKRFIKLLWLGVSL